MGAAVGHPAADRGDHLGEAEVQPRSGDHGLGGFEIGLRLQHRRLAGVDFLLAGGLGGQQGLGAGQLNLGVLKGRRGAAFLAGGLLHHRLVGPRVDLEQHLALADELPVGEVDLDDVAGDARTQLDGGGGLEAADVLVPVADLALQRRGDHDAGQGRRRLLLGAARGQPDQRDKKESPDMLSHATPQPPGA